MAEKMLVLTDATRRQIEANLRRLGQLQREMAGLQTAGVMDCTEYSELCKFVQESLERKHNYFWPRGNLRRAAKGDD